MPLTLYRALVIIDLLALSSESILLSLPCAEQGVSGQRPWPPHLMRLLAYLPMAPLRWPWSSTFGNNSACIDLAKMAFFRCIPIHEGGLFMLFGQIIVIAVAIMKTISVPITFNLIPEWRLAKKIEEMHDGVVKKYWYKPLKAFALLALWATTITNTNSGLKLKARIRNEYVQIRSPTPCKRNFGTLSGFLHCQRLLPFCNSALALYVVFHPSRLRSRTVCDDHTKFYIAFFKCIPLDDGGLIVCRIIVISAIVIKSISVPITFDLLPIRYGRKVERMHRYVTKKYLLKPLRAFVLLVLWAISVTNSDRTSPKV